MFYDANPAYALGSWIAIAPAIVVVVLLISQLPNPFTRFPKVHRGFRAIRRALTTFVPLHEAEALNSPHPEDSRLVPNRGRWHSVLFAFLGILEVLAWVADASYFLVATPFDVCGVIVRFLVAFSWIYATIRPITHPSTTVPYPLFVIYLLHFIFACLQFGGVLFDTALSETPLPSMLILAGLSANLGITATLLYVTMTMPIGLPSRHVKKEDIVSPIIYEAGETEFNLGLLCLS
jgi:hypothetical protein